MKKLLFLASGRGSCFQAVAHAIGDASLAGAQIVGLICNKASAPVVDIAESRGIPTTVLSRELFMDSRGKWNRASYEQALVEAITAHAPDWICLAGYMLLLAPDTVRRWPGKIINIHPSLLPAYPGLHAQKQALEAGAKVTGCTVHLVTEGLDDGPIIEQTPVDILAGDTEETLSARLLPLEHATYVRALSKLCAHTFTVKDNRVVWDLSK